MSLNLLGATDVPDLISDILGTADASSILESEQSHTILMRVCAIPSQYLCHTDSTASN
ncbi:MAG: hypothetical protein J07HQW2_02512 [Haloquadratum walsbyi J07HQW2]|jgi:hypothetical protein|uniref:Uncharacterized protein n=1 Tax=Haloquadratum walsbyi J07HQW2 TaxID=1238425 RepID=U1NG14_9EURY|nr:MAG: hypothetical protein J07HQW2_02512 [Haloquadratum walsbyi J07HQW2]